MRHLALVFVCAALALWLIPTDASATCFCMLRPVAMTTSTQRGITSDPSYSPASAVVILRDGRRTVLTIEAAYQGPATELSMVIPIPSAIDREAVRTVSGTLFRRLDAETAPRVRHVWPPCPLSRMASTASAEGSGASAGFSGRTEAERVQEDYGVEIQDEWPVDEYDVTLLGAEQSNGLLAFLRERGLELPQVAETMLRGYIESGHRFALFHVDPTRAQRLGERMMLSPIQIEYESDELRVPVRLGTLNSPGEQELLLYVLSPEGRYEMANRTNLNAPTDLRMRRDARGAFAELYTSMTDEIFRRNPGAAITEYAHTVPARLMRSAESFGITDVRARLSGYGDRGIHARRWTLSRMRHRYGTEATDDLMLRQAAPLRLTRSWRHRALRQRVREGESGFHVQYVVEHTERCTDASTQRRIAGRFATAESMWESRHDVWPGQLLLDRVDLLSIEPGSSAPEGWPPAPIAIQPTPLEQAAATPVTPTPVAEATAARNTIAPSNAAAATQARAPNNRTVAAEGCSAGHAGSGAWWMVMLALGWVARRRRE